MIPMKSNNIIRIISRSSKSSSSSRSSLRSLQSGRSLRSCRSMTSQNSLWLCLLLCYTCNIFGLLQMTLLAEALPFEYMDEHDDLNYDLDTVQSQAKYDAHLLSQQMLSDAELEQKKNTNTDTASGNSQEDLEPHSRAAACFSSGHRYTHGQKVPRWDPCEVCLCMDGEIFCWWEKCDKVKANTPRSDYSDPYHYESTTKVTTKVHKTARKVGKRHKYHKNQKNFNDEEQVYHSPEQLMMKKQQQTDYKKQTQKQQKQKDSSNYNKIKQHKHEQQQQKLELATFQQQELVVPPKKQEQRQLKAASLVNQAAKEMHYQQQQQKQHQTHQQPHQQQQHEQQQKQHLHTHPHQSHSSSKILNFPENLPALLYYDYKTEEHEHHQHQHHQQHLLHQKLRLQQQHQHSEQQKLQQQQRAQAIVTSTSSQRAEAGVEPSTKIMGADKNFDEAETDSDILPEPPTKRPKATWTTKAAATVTTTGSTAKALMTTNTLSPLSPTSTLSSTTQQTMETTKQTAVDKKNEMPSISDNRMGTGTDTKANTMQHLHKHGEEAENLDDAFHRWLTSTETELSIDSDNMNALDAAGLIPEEQETSTIIDDVGAKSGNSYNYNNSESNNFAVTETNNKLVTEGGSSYGSNKDTSTGNNNNNIINNNNIAGNADAVFFRSSYNDYSSEFNGSVVNIDITLTAVDVHPPQEHSEHQMQHRHRQLPEATTHMLANVKQTDLIANDNKTFHVAANSQTTTTTTATSTTTTKSVATPTTTTEPVAASNSNQYTLPPYTLTTIITTTPLATERMCNVLGKLYRIGDILPQDTGNCLQCICTDAITPDEQPSVTCSPHNCPPLVLPDLFDATGY